MPAVDAGARDQRAHGGRSRARPSPRRATTSARSASATPTWAPCSWCRASPTTRRRPRRSAGRSPRSCTPRPTRPRRRWPRELGPFPRYRGNRDAMLRVIRNHRRAAYNAPPRSTRASPSRRSASTRRYCPPDLLAGRARELDRMLELGEQHGYRNAQVTVHRADRHHRPGHGLRHHRHRAGLRPREVQEARRRRLLQDHQPASIPPALRAARLHAEARSTTSCATAAGPARSRAARTSTTATPQGQGLHRRRRCSKIEAQLPGAFELPSSSTAGRSATTSSQRSSASTRSSSTRPDFDLLARARASPGRRSTRPTTSSAAP